MSRIVRESMRDKYARRELTPEDTRRLQELWDQGKASGSAERLDFADIRREARTQLNAATRNGNGLAPLILPPAQNPPSKHNPALVGRAVLRIMTANRANSRALREDSGVI